MQGVCAETFPQALVYNHVKVPAFIRGKAAVAASKSFRWFGVKPSQPSQRCKRFPLTPKSEVFGSTFVLGKVSYSVVKP